MNLDHQTLKFWSAAQFYRRSGRTDMSLAVKVLEQVAADAPPRLQDRAVTVLVEIDNEQFKSASNV
jgi:hypothetical protein